MTINELRKLLISAQQLTGQTSYERRAPSPKAIPALLKAKLEISRFISENTDSAEAYRLLSLTHECLLHYSDARSSFEKALSLCAQRHPKDLKHLALLREYENKWEEFALTPEELHSLGKHLNDSLTEHGCDHTPKHTKHWLAQFSPDKQEQKLKALRNWGGHCDCEVRSNAVQSVC